MTERKDKHYEIKNPTARLAFSTFYYGEDVTLQKNEQIALCEKERARVDFERAEERLRDAKTKRQNAMQSFADRLAEAEGLTIETMCTERFCYHHSDCVVVVVRPVKA